MLATIIYIIGVVLTIMAAVDVCKLNANIVKKIVVIVILLLTSWIGLAFYYLYAKDRLAGWLK